MARFGTDLHNLYLNPATCARRTEKNIAQKFCACVIVELEHEYIRNVNVPTDRQTDRQNPRRPHHVGLAQARPNDNMVNVSFFLQLL